MNIRVQQYSKLFYLLIGMVMALIMLFGMSTKGHAVENLTETEVDIESLQKYLYDENGNIYFDISKAEQNGESVFILEIGNTYNSFAKLDDYTIEGKKKSCMGYQYSNLWELLWIRYRF